MKGAANFFRFMRAREQIRLDKEKGLAWPWTNDPILQAFKFTNVKREHDRTTRELRAEFYEANREASLKIQLLNCAIFRYFGSIEFARAVGWQSSFRPTHIKRVAARRLKRGEKVFTGAYMITNQKIAAPKQDVVVDVCLRGIWEYSEEIITFTRATRRWRAMIEEIQKIKGFGGTGFMAKEVVLDTMFTSIWPEPPIDLNTWCPTGPGARRGINRLLGQYKKTTLKPEFKLEFMLELFEQRHKYWPEDWIELELHDIQFQLCEWDKYERTRLGEGRPRSRYHAPA